MTTSFDAQTLKEVARLWQVRLKKLRHDIPVQGSPERSVFRVVLEDEIGRYFLLEQIPANSLERKKLLPRHLIFYPEIISPVFSHTWRINKANLLSTTKMIFGRSLLSRKASRLIEKPISTNNGAARRWPIFSSNCKAKRKICLRPKRMMLFR